MASSVDLHAGFFKSKRVSNGDGTYSYDRVYTAEDISGLFDGIWTNGIFKSSYKDNNALKVSILSPAVMGIRVLPGRAWFNGTWTSVDSILSMAIDDPDMSLDRIDAVALVVDKRDAYRENSIEIVKGTPASNPKKPEPQNEEDHYYHILGYVTVKHGAKSIVLADIEDNRGTSSIVDGSETSAHCPWVNGITTTVSIESLYANRSAIWNEFADINGNAIINKLQEIATFYENNSRPNIGDLKPIVKYNVGIGIGKWGTFTPESQTLESRLQNMGYVYRGLMTSGLSNVTSTMRAYITWDPSYIENCGADIASVYQCTNSGIYIYANNKPNQILYALTVECRKAVT